MKKIFIHIGYHKTATTLLQEHFYSKHSDIGYLGKADKYPVPEICELFHNLYEDSDTHFSVKDNQKIFQKALKVMNLKKKKILIFGLSDEGLSGGIDWFGGMAVSVAERICKVFDGYDVKILIGLREQRSMMVSFYTEYIKRGGTNSLNRLLKSPFSNGRFIFDKLEYLTLINEYIKLFSKQNVFIYLYEEIRQDPQSLIDSITKFLEISNFKMINNGRSIVNKKPSILGIMFLKVTNHFFFSPFNNNAYVLPITPLIGNLGWILLRNKLAIKIYPKLLKIQNWDYYLFEQQLCLKIKTEIDNLIINLDKRTFAYFPFLKLKISKDLELICQKNYKVSNKKLAKLINKDLKRYNYL